VGRLATISSLEQEIEGIMHAVAIWLSPLMILYLAAGCVAAAPATEKAGPADVSTQQFLLDIARLEAFTGSKHHWTNQDGALIEVSLTGEMSTDKSLASLARIPTLTRLSLHCARGTDSITARGIAELSKLPKLGYLKLSGVTRVLTPEMANGIGKCMALEELRISYTDIPIESATLISRFETLRVLAVTATKTWGDRETEVICKLPKLRVLDVSGTNVSSASVQAMRLCETLGEVYAGRTRMTKASAGDRRLTRVQIYGMAE
jgi:hypothetical protein